MLRSYLRALWEAPSAKLALVGVIAFSVMALVGPMLLAEEAKAYSVMDAHQPASWSHPFGTDSLGRDILLRTVVATRLSLGLAFASAGVAALLGFTTGAITAIAGKRVRMLGARIIDASLSFPPILVAVIVTAIVGPSILGAVLSIGVAFAPTFARVANTLASSIAGRDYVAAARVVGVPRIRLFYAYLLPNLADTLALVLFSTVGLCLVAISSLSFLGLGVQPPEFDWGRMLTEGIDSIYTTPAAALAPAAAILLAGLSLGYLGEAVSRAMNPLVWTPGVSKPNSLAARDVKKKGVAIDRGQFLIREKNLGPEVSAPLPSESSADVVIARDLTVRFGDNTVAPSVDSVCIRVGPSEVVGLVGESGSGKTLSALSIAQLVPHPGKLERGSVSFLGRDLLALPEAELDPLLGLGLGMVFQDPGSSLNPTLKIGVQLTEALEIHRGLGRDAARVQAVSWLKRVGLSAAEMRMDQYPHEMSGGMKQRVMIAMALIREPALIIADEPTTALDVTIQAQILALLESARVDVGASVLLITHDMAVIHELADRVMVMYQGRVVEELRTSQLDHQALHPYTRALVQAVPDIGTDRDQPLATIPKSDPALASRIAGGCQYASRCPWVLERCFSDRPDLMRQGQDHRVACWVPGGTAS